MESRDARNSCMDMNNNNNNNQKNMVVGFDGVGGYARENNTMTMMMMMPPLSTTTTTSTTTSACSSTFFFPHHLPPLPHHPSQNHAATTNSNNHHGRLITSGCLSGVVPSNLSMDQLLFNQTNGNQDSMLNKPSSSNCLMADLDNNNHNESSSSSSMKAKIMAHPHYPRLLAAYINCQKVGAPPEVVGRLEAACAAMSEVGRAAGYVGEDPALDQFMEAYCEMLTKYEQELTKPFNEAMVFLSRIECQFKALTLSSNSNNAPYLFSSSAPQFSPAAVAAASSDACGDGIQGNGLSDEQIDVNTNLIDPQADDDELKYQLLRKYSGSLGSLKQEFMKKRKKGKLPKEARQQLLDWWTNHYKWPYPTETQKIALAESTGLDPKQINNWFINQRKRHWKPSEDMQLVVMDASHPHHQYYMTDNVLGNPFPMDHFYPAFL